MSRDAQACLGVLARGEAPHAMWFDGGERGWLGIHADRVLEGDDLSLLDDVEVEWRADPGAVWLGWLTYDVGAHAVCPSVGRRGALPGLGFRRFSSALRLQPGKRQWLGAPATLPEVDVQARWPWQRLQPVLPPEEHRRRVVAAQRRIAAGDTYQVNLAQPFVAPWRVAMTDRAVVEGYACLRSRSVGSMGGLFKVGDAWVVSNSPETLLRVRGREATSQPIKGTRPVHGRAGADRLALDELQASGKDEAEHRMIVDLVRNDLGQLAVPGTVQAPARPTPLTLSTVHHLVSEVTATLEPGTRLRDLVGALFPGGSITGAPKRKTIEIIDTLEQRARGIYCGSLVALTPEGIDMSIAIRTAIVESSGLLVFGGGGIVIDSDPEAERLETVAKVQAFDR